MADTDWNAFVDAVPAAGDMLIAQRGGGGVNLDAQYLVTKDAQGAVAVGATGNALARGCRFSITEGYQAEAVGSGAGLFLSYHPGAPSGRRLWHWFGGENGYLIFQSLNDSYTTAETFLIAGGTVFSNAFLSSGYDNGVALGRGDLRFSVLYCATGAINTSDERDKDWRGGIDEAESRAARRIIAELGFYRWLDAIEAKGDEARYHFGARAQRVWGIMADEGLVDPIVDGRPGRTPYAFLCFNEWDAVEPRPAMPAAFDADGKLIAAAVPAEPGRDAGSRFGLRTDQLTLFLIASQERRLAALEAAA